MYIKRAMEETISRTEKSFKAILVTGPRQVGKSTVLKHLYEDRKYITFDDPVLLSETKTEPGLFFRNNKPPVILDEVQYISELFPYIKMECDKTDEKGKFCLTGLQQYYLMKNISESLAGRVGILELSGLSMREIAGVSFNEPFIPSENYITEREKDYKNIDNLWDLIHRGSYPALIDKAVEWQMFYSSYVQTYIDRDINELGKVKDKLKFTQFLTAMAGALFETFVVSEILKSFTNAGRDYRMNVSYYRGKDKQRRKINGERSEHELEIDLIIEQDDTLYPVEIKMSANPKLGMTNAFDVIDKVKGKTRGTGVILCMYESPLWLKDNIVALPIEYI